MGMTTEQLRFAAAHMTNCRKHGYRKYRALIEADCNANGQTLATMLKTAYGASDIADYSGGYKDFSLVFDSVTRRDEVVDKINAAVNAYRDAHPEIVPETVLPSAEDPGNAGADEGKKTASWTNYLIIGAAAVAVVLLLWDRKKK